MTDVRGINDKELGNDHTLLSLNVLQIADSLSAAAQPRFSTFPSLTSLTIYSLIKKELSYTLRFTIMQDTFGKIYMNWQDILTIIVPLGAFMGWIYSRVDRKFDAVDKRFDAVDRKFEEKFDGIHHELQEVKSSLAQIDSRLSRLEGRLEEREFQEWKQRKTG